MNINGVIYKIENLLNGKVYIGQTVNYDIRKRNHYNLLIKGNHYNEHLQRTWDTYGESNFRISALVLDVKSDDELNLLEIKYIKDYNAYNSKFGYNKTFGGVGVRHTEETREKVSKALKGKAKSKEHCENIRKSKIGVNTLSKMSKERLAERSRKLSAATSGKNNPMYGKRKPDSTIEKLRMASSGKNNPMYGKNIKDYMTEDAYEQWKKNVSNLGEKNGMARKTVVVYRNQKYNFGYAAEAIKHFKSKGEPITINWFYRGINKYYTDIFQFVGYEEDYKLQYKY